ncbi:MAG: hypothetical protein LUC20_08200 [Oscillospiraceae bacterium]|nr:hypothetical protein [Oscillospiraceae bacterium]
MKRKLKNNGGYVLIYVLVVFALLSALAGTVSGVALKNLRAQEVAISRMEHLYAAEGKIEELVAKAQSQTTKDDFASCITNSNGNADDISYTAGNGSGTYTVIYTASKGGVTVTATVDFVVAVDTVEAEDGSTTKIFTVNDATYTAYDISG